MTQAGRRTGWGKRCRDAQIVPTPISLSQVWSATEEISTIDARTIELHTQKLILEPSMSAHMTVSSSKTSKKGTTLKIMLGSLG